MFTTLLSKPEEDGFLLRVFLLVVPPRAENSLPDSVKNVKPVISKSGKYGLSIMKYSGIGSALMS